MESSAGSPQISQGRCKGVWLQCGQVSRPALALARVCGHKKPSGAQWRMRPSHVSFLQALGHLFCRSDMQDLEDFKLLSDDRAEH